MSDFKPAPENQPTSNIELQLRHAERKRDEWDRMRIDLSERLDSARGQSEYWQASIDILKYQLEQRRTNPYRSQA